MIKASVCSLLVIISFLSIVYAEGNIKKGMVNKEIIKQQFDNLIIKTNRIIKEIDINLGAYHKVESEIMDRSTEGGTLYGYYEGNILVKLIADFCGETGNNKTSYYFEKKNLVYIVEVEQLYDKPIPIYEGKVKVIKEDIFKYYIQNSQIRLMIDNEGKVLNKSQNELNNMSKNIMQDVQEFATKLNKEYVKTGNK